VLREHVEVDVEVRLAVLPQEPRLHGLVAYALERRHAGVLRVHALAHELHDQERRQAVQVRFAAAGGTGGTDGVVDVETRTENRRIADPARNLPGEAAGGGDAADVPGGVDAVAVDRAVEVLRIDLALGDHLPADRVTGGRTGLGIGVVVRV